MAASCSYDTSANASPTNKEHLLTDLLDEIQNTLEEGLHTYCEEDPLGLKRHDISRSSLGYVRQTETITCVSVRIVANRDSIYRTEIERNEAKADLELIAETVANRYESRSFVACNTSRSTVDMVLHATTNTNQVCSIPVFPFEVCFFKTPYYSSPEPTEKIMWDAFCRARARSSKKSEKRELRPDDWGKEFPYGKYTYKILGPSVSQNATDGENYIDVLRTSGYRALKFSGRIKRQELERALYEMEYEDKSELAIEKSHAEESEFYRNKCFIQQKLVASGIDVVYREVFSIRIKTQPHEFQLVGVIKKARKYPFLAECIDETGEYAGKRCRLSYNAVIEAIKLNRK